MVHTENEKRGQGHTGTRGSEEEGGTKRTGRSRRGRGSSSTAPALPSAAHRRRFHSPTRWQPAGSPRARPRTASPASAPSLPPAALDLDPGRQSAQELRRPEGGARPRGSQPGSEHFSPPPHAAVRRRPGRSTQSHASALRARRPAPQPAATPLRLVPQPGVRASVLCVPRGQHRGGG